MNQRKYRTVSFNELLELRQQGDSLKEISEKLSVSLQGLQQACSLIDELNDKRPFNPRIKPFIAPAHDPFSICRH